MLSRNLGLRQWDERFRNMAVYGYFKGSERLPSPNESNIFIESYPDGWVWNIPLCGDLSSVGVVVDSQQGVHLAMMSAVMAAAYIDAARGDPSIRSPAADIYHELYHKEYSHFRELAALFYASNRTVESYFWESRRILGASDDEGARASFIRAVAGQSVRGEALQEPIISVRGDRFVVPVRADRRHRVSGIVHDASNTGATVFVEPFTTVELCNEWRELALEEEREVNRVLRDLSSLVGAVAGDIRSANRTTAMLDLALARARYSRRLDAVTPASAGSGQRLRLIRARHPLLDSDAAADRAHRARLVGARDNRTQHRRVAVLLDEIGTSTDPEEGSALAKAVISHLAHKGAATIVTTQHRTVAAFADGSGDMMNASFQLDPETLRPTYEMTIGAPGRSYAMAVAERLGIPSQILDEARSMIEPQHLLFEDWLNELQRERQQLQTNVEQTAVAKAEAESLRQELERQVDFLVSHRDDMIETARRSVIQRFREISRRLDGAEASLRWAVPTVAGGGPPPTLDRVERIRRDLASVEIPVPVPTQRPQPVSRPLAEGDTVFIRGMNLTGRIVEFHRQSDEVEVSIGRVRVNVDLHRLSRVDSEPEEEADADTPRVTTDLAPPLESAELDLRGVRAWMQVNLGRVFRAVPAATDCAKCTVIHGRGTGVLRNVVRDHLRYHRAVSDFGPEPREHGGDGATWGRILPDRQDGRL
ncbi:Endonuclease MutS2 [Geodia barretti]|uniref:Endonuclease MutS2 n=1 Tax=Geodia barretti TaxID=519541 RepID=A0AA35SJ38_GEOBA|nr:Endonuclease MutS2 [Geodia barretti]